MQPPTQDKAPFDAELLVLFGIPVLTLVLAYAFNDPKTLGVAIPLALLVPGPRDVLLHVCSDLWQGATRARRFVSSEEAVAAEAARRSRWSARQAWSRRRPATQVEYELGQDEYSITPPPPAPPPPPPPTAGAAVRPPAQNVEGGWGDSGSWGGTEAWPFSHSSSYDNEGSWREPASAPSSRIDGAVEDAHAAGARRRLRSVRQFASHRPEQQQSSEMLARRRPAGRFARPAGQGRVGVSLGSNTRERDSTPLLLRPLFALVPFLRHWGGFL